MTKHRVFIVDDDEDLCDLFEASLNAAGHAVSCCMDPATAIAQCKEFAPDLILMDLSLPGTSGEELFKQMMQASINTPLAYLTAETSETKKQTLLEAGAVAVLVKPLTPVQLVGAVEKLLSTARESLQKS